MNACGQSSSVCMLCHVQKFESGRLTVRTVTVIVSTGATDSDCQLLPNRKVAHVTNPRAVFTVGQVASLALDSRTLRDAQALHYLGARD